MSSAEKQRDGATDSTEGNVENLKRRGREDGLGREAKGAQIDRADTGRRGSWDDKFNSGFGRGNEESHRRWERKRYENFGREYVEGRRRQSDERTRESDRVSHKNMDRKSYSAGRIETRYQIRYSDREKVREDEKNVPGNEKKCLERSIIASESIEKAEDKINATKEKSTHDKSPREGGEMSNNSESDLEPGEIPNYESPSSFHAQSPHFSTLFSPEKPLKSSDPSKELTVVSKELKSGPLPKRPDEGGVGGREVAVRVNHYDVRLRADMEINQYEVSISPEVKSPKVNHAIMAEIVRLYRKEKGSGPHLGGKTPAYDGGKVLFTYGPLPQGEDGGPIIFRDIVPLEDLEIEGRKGKRKKVTFQVSIRFVSKLNIRALRDFLAGKLPEHPIQTINALDIVMRVSPSLNYIPVFRSFFSSEFGRPHPIGGGAVNFKGFFQSLRPSQRGLRVSQTNEIEGLTLNLDLCNTPFIAPLPVPEFVAQFFNFIVGESLGNFERTQLLKTLRNVKVEVTHQEYRRKYRITGITEKRTRDLWFSTRDEATGKSTEVSLVAFFKNRYGIRLRHLNLPALEVGPTHRHNWLPMEVCCISPNQKLEKKLTSQQSTAMLLASKQTPSQREADIHKIGVLNNYNNDLYASEFGVKVGKNLVEIKARVSNPPKIQYSSKGRISVVTPNLGFWNLQDVKVVEGSSIQRWACINFTGNHGRDAVRVDLVENFCREVVKLCDSIGVKMNPNMLFPVLSCPPKLPEVEEKLREVVAMASKSWKKLSGAVDFIFCILPNNNTIYGDIKRICELELGIISQCVLAKNVIYCNKKFLTNLCFKLNPKMGGRNHWLVAAKERKLPKIGDIPTILFGADVTHPSPGDDTSPSISAVVASQDWPEVTTYRGLVRSQNPGQEIISNLFVPQPKEGEREGMVTEHLFAFKSRVGEFPGRILFFRDGVSEGQFPMVRDLEVEAIRKACLAMDPSYQPKITFLTVQKRHHTRLFPAEKATMVRNGNVYPGTVVDTDICSPHQFDFFLCSHGAIQGVSRPAKYVVLWDDNNFNSTELQSLINDICYTYQTCSHSVSMAPAAYYAHRLAARARFYLPPENERNKKMMEQQVGYYEIPDIKEDVKRVMFYC